MPTVAPEQTSLRELGAPGGEVPISILVVAGKKKVDVTLAETGFEFVEVPRRAMVTHLLNVPVQRWCNPERSHQLGNRAATSTATGEAITLLTTSVVSFLGHLYALTPSCDLLSFGLFRVKDTRVMSWSEA